MSETSDSALALAAFHESVADPARPVALARCVNPAGADRAGEMRAHEQHLTDAQGSNAAHEKTLLGGLRPSLPALLSGAALAHPTAPPAPPAPVADSEAMHDGAASARRIRTQTDAADHRPHNVRMSEIQSQAATEWW